MMTEQSNQSIEIKISKNDFPVPLVNGVHLHSMYNPQKEAETFADKNLQVLKDKNNILVLGLGFAYHLEALLDRMNKLNPNKKNHIIVIDPSIELFEECKRNKRLLKSDQIEYICGVNVSKLYTNQYFINFLLENPGVIAHPASFSLHKTFFTKFLDHKASTYLEDVQNNIIDKELKSYLCNSSNNINHWQEFTDSIFNASAVNNNNDFLVMSLKGFDSAQHGEMNE